MTDIKENKETIDLMAQQEHLMAFLRKFWSFDGLQLKDGSSFTDPVEAIVITALKAGEKDATYWLDAYGLDVDEKLKSRKKFLSSEYNDFIYYDDVYHFLDRLASNAFTHGRDKIDVEGNDWSFEVRANLVFHEIEKLFDGDDFQYVAPVDYQQKREDSKWVNEFAVIKNAYSGFRGSDPNVRVNERL